MKNARNRGTRRASRTERYGSLSPWAAVATLLLPSAAHAQTWTNFQVGSETRKALVYVPDGIVEPPLLISLHGRGIGASWNQGGMMKFEPIADREKFVVVYPEANNDLNWDLGGDYDVNFVLKIIEDMSDQYGIDRNRVYASGFSMGGMFSYTLACRIPEAIAAIAPGNGYPLGGQSGCVNTRSVPIFHIHGTADDFVPYSGIHAFLGTKVSAYGCPATPVTTDPYPAAQSDSKSFKEYWGVCTNDNGTKSSITLVSVAGMIHDWATAGKANTNEDPEFAGKPFDIDGSEEAWAFLKTQSLLGPDDPDAGGTGGSHSGGSTGSGGSDASSAGAPSGTAGEGGAGDDGGPRDDTAGCSCAVGPSTPGAGGWLVGLLFGLTAARQAGGGRRRRQRDAAR